MNYKIIQRKSGLELHIRWPWHGSGMEVIHKSKDPNLNDGIEILITR